MPSQAHDRLLDQLKLQFGVRNIIAVPDYLVVVEGTTDRSYLLKAAELIQASTGANPFSVPPQLRNGPHDDALIVVPGTASQPDAGGVDRMVDLARSLVRDFFGGGVLSGILFVFDHDHAGRTARDQISKYGYKPGLHSITLDPSEHPGAPAGNEVVIEDLLPLALQKSFFDLGGTSCDLQYRRGQLQRLKWVHPSKAALRNHVSSNGTFQDFEEVRKLTSRIRSALGFPAL